MATKSFDVSNTTCNICRSRSEFIFSKKILMKYTVSFFQCNECGFVQTEKPFWLSDTYQSLLFAMDTGLISRPLLYSQITDNLIMRYFDPAGKFIDYGGGSGIFVRLMRDRGFNFFRQDKYVSNICALFFDVSDLSIEERHFELLTSFEVLEHLVNPMEELRELFSFSNNLLCSTVLQPSTNVNDLNSWWYLGELHGQHISFYTEKSMKIIAENYRCYYYSNNVDLHLFTPRKLKGLTFRPKQSNILTSSINRLIPNLYNKLRMMLPIKAEKLHPESLTLKDSDLIKQQIIKGKFNVGD